MKNMILLFMFLISGKYIYRFFLTEYTKIINNLGPSFVKNINVQEYNENDDLEDKCTCNSLKDEPLTKKYLFGTKASHKLDSYEEMPLFSVDFSKIKKHLFEIYFSLFRHLYKDSRTDFISRTLSSFQLRQQMSPPLMPLSLSRSCPRRQPGSRW